MTLAATPLTRKVTIDEAVEMCWQAFLDDGHKSYTEAVAAVWPTLTFDTAAFEMLAMDGLIQRVKDEKHSAIQGTNNGRPIVPYGAPHGKKWEQYVALSWPFKGANGTMKPLLEFSRDDLAAFAHTAGVMAQSWQRRVDWATTTDELLKEHGKSCVRDLPKDVLAQVNDAAREAMGRQA